MCQQQKSYVQSGMNLPKWSPNINRILKKKALHQHPLSPLLFHQHDSNYKIAASKSEVY